MDDRTEIRVGASLSRSGWCWLDTGIISPAVKLWVEETNDRGGMYVPDAGRRLPVRLVAYDDESDPGREIEVVTRMIEDDRIDVFCSSASAEMQYEVLPITEEHRVVNLNIGAPDPELFEFGHRYHLQCGPGLGGWFASRPPFWAQHGLERVAQIYADFWGWRSVAEPLADLVEAQPGTRMVHRLAVERAERWSTAYGPFAREFDGWPGLVEELRGAEPDVVVISLPSPAQYRIMREMRRQHVWFRYLEMMYGPHLERIGFGSEDLLYQFHGGGTGPPIRPEDVNVGGTRADFDRRIRARGLTGAGNVLSRGFVALSIWEHLVGAAGTLDAGAVMEQAQRESGKVVTMYGPIAWKPNGDTVVGEGLADAVHQIQRHPHSAELTSVRVHPNPTDGVRPVLTDRAYEDRSDPWLGDEGVRLEHE